MSARNAGWAVLALVVAAVVVACASVASATMRPTVTAATLTAAGDTVYLAIRWTPSAVTDGRGPVDGYTVTATRTTPTPAATITASVGAAVTTARLAIPTGGVAVGGTVAGSVCVASTRRGAASPGACIPWSIVWQDAPPPAPTGVAVDTLRLSQVRASDSLVVMYVVALPDAAKLVATPCTDGSSTACAAALTAAFPGRTVASVLHTGCGYLYRGTGRTFVVQEPASADSAVRWMDCNAVFRALGSPKNADAALVGLALAVR